MKFMKRLRRYFPQYTVANVLAMLQNSKREPEKCEERFDGKLVVITGATSGIGRCTAKKYASMGADLVLINRNRQKSSQLCDEIKNDYSVECSDLIADLSSIEEVERACTELLSEERPVDVLILNAGLFMKKRTETVDGLEMVFAVNYFSAFLMTWRLQAKLKKQESCRIILVSSEGHRFAAWGLRMDDLQWKKRLYHGLSNYGEAKLAQLLSMRIFAEDFEGSGVTINAMHPGAVKTDSGKDNSKLYKWYKKNVMERNLKDPDVSAEALYYLGVSPETAGINGKFFSLTTLEDPAPPAVDDEAARQIWEVSKAIRGLE